MRFKGEFNPSVIKKLCVQCSLLGHVIHAVFVNDFKVGLLSAVPKLLCQNKNPKYCSPEKIFFS